MIQYTDDYEQDKLNGSSSTNTWKTQENPGLLVI